MSLTLRSLLTDRGIPFEEGVPMSGWTTLKVGGPADFWVQARGAEDIAGALEAAGQCGAQVTVLGRGSNLLVGDGGIRGLVLYIGEGMPGITISGERLFVEAGARLSAVAMAAQAAGLAGMEAISGIPGTMGGALAMNAGSYGVEIGRLAVSVEAMDAQGILHTVGQEEMRFGYRTSLLQEKGWIALGTCLALQKDEPEAIMRRIREYARRRREKQPLDLPSAGSFFKRPQGYFAGALIEAAGLKGTSVGGAQVSTLHAGFLVNTGGATAKDFLELMALVQERVFTTSGVKLEPEVRIIGCNSSC